MLEKAGVDELIGVTGPSQVDNSLTPRKIISFSPVFISILLKMPPRSYTLPKPSACRCCHEREIALLSIWLSLYDT